MASSLALYRSTRDMRVARSLPSAPSDSTRGPLPYFNSLLTKTIEVSHDPQDLVSDQKDNHEAVKFFAPGADRDQR